MGSDPIGTRMDETICLTSPKELGTTHQLWTETHKTLEKKKASKVKGVNRTKSMLIAKPVEKEKRINQTTYYLCRLNFADSGFITFLNMLAIHFDMCMHIKFQV